MSEFKNGDRIVVDNYDGAIEAQNFIGKPGVVTDTDDSTFIQVALDDGRRGLLFYPRELRHEAAEGALAFHALLDALFATPSPELGLEDPPEDPRVETNLVILVIAGQNKQEVEFRYVKEDGSIQTRRFIPEIKTANRHGDVIFFGHDTDRDDARSFRLDRINDFVRVIG